MENEIDTLRKQLAQAQHQVHICEQAFELDEAVKIPEVGNLNALQFRRTLDNLQTQLEEARNQARELAMVVQVATDDDPGSAITAIRKIQSAAAKKMRDSCVRLIRQIAVSEVNGHANGGMLKAANAIESLSVAEALREQDTKEEVLARRRALMPDYDEKLEEWLS